MKFLLFFLTCSLASCDGGGGGSGITGTTDLTDSPIVGGWISPCDASSGALSFLDTVEFFEDGTFIRTISGYFDLECTVPGFDGTNAGILRESNAFELPDRGIVRNVDFTTTSYSITPRSEGSALFFNSELICGISNWEVGVNYDISSCSNRPGDDNSRRPLPYSDFSIYLVERGQLFYGSELSFTAENRTNSLATRPVYIRPTGAIGDEFPQDVKGFWVLPESNQYAEILDQGLIRFYGQTNEGCFELSFVTLFSDGGNQYLDPFKLLSYTLSGQDGNLLLSFGNDPQEFVFVPSDIAVGQLNQCA